MAPQLRSHRALTSISASVGMAGFLIGLKSRSREISFRGRVVAITGGSRGLGLVVARVLASQGARLALCSRNADELNRARYELESMGAEVIAQTCDVSRKDEVHAWIGGVLEHFGRIDVLINNAGIIQVGPAAEMTEVDIQQAMDINFWGGVHASYAVLPQMIRQGGGRIVNITSIGGIIAVPHLLPYSAAKFAAVGFSDGLRSEVSQYGIHVTTVVPGLMRTGSFLNALFKGKRESELGWFSLGASVPGISICAESAALQIVEAARKGKSFVILGFTARIARMIAALFPSTTAVALRLVNELLPSPSPSGQRHFRSRQSAKPGHLYRERGRNRKIFRSGALVLGEKAARRNNENESGAEVTT